MYPNYLQKEDLYEIFTQIKHVDEEIFSVIIEILRGEKIMDCIQYLSDNENQKHYEQYIFQGGKFENFDKQWKLEAVKNNIKKISNFLKKINQHTFSKNDYSEEFYRLVKKNLIYKIRMEKMIIKFFKFLVQLTSIDNQFIQCGSNSLHFLVKMKIDLSDQCFESIKIRNTQLKGANFSRCNLNESQFENVDISRINLNGASLFNCNWKKIKIHDVNKKYGHNESFNSICASYDGTILASGSSDMSVRLWDVKTGLQKNILYGHNNTILSVSFSPDGTTIASGSQDNSIRLWDVKTEKQKAKLDGHSGCINSVCFSPNGTRIASCSDDISIHVKTGQKFSKSDQSNKAKFSKFNTSQFQNNPYLQFNENITVQLISNEPVLQAQGAQIYKGYFENHFDQDLRYLLKQRGCIFLDNQEDGLQNLH